MKCGKHGCTGDLYVTNTYSAGPQGSVQRCECCKCGTVHTVTKFVASVNPRYGEGAAAVAARLRKKNASDQRE